MDSLTLKGTLYARPETCYWDAATLERHGILEAFCLYCIPDDESGTIDVTTYAVRNEFIFLPGIDEVAQSEAREELEYEGIENVDYLMRSEVDRADSRLKKRIEVEEFGDFEDMHPEFMRDRLMEEATDMDMDILDPVAWGKWDRERTEKRRARNLPPIANWGANGLDNLPLFAAAAERLLAPHRPALERLKARGDCSAYRAAKGRLEALNWAWAL